LGKSGIRALKREGDGATPRGRFPLRNVLIRPSAANAVRTTLPRSLISERDGWCDAPRDRNYNRGVRLPYPASTESLWRDDGLYDIVAVVAYNERPRKRFRGSAIFMHIARENFAPTEGCVALRRKDLQRLLARIQRHVELHIKT
jgi:L,D-peptidoglycan transpeptidase YkuD (ErfK/YbiS/YcfS/YnhG family)